MSVNSAFLQLPNLAEDSSQTGLLPDSNGSSNTFLLSRGPEHQHRKKQGGGTTRAQRKRGSKGSKENRKPPTTLFHSNDKKSTKKSGGKGKGLSVQHHDNGIKGKSGKSKGKSTASKIAEEISDQDRCDVQYVAIDFAITLNDPTLSPAMRAMTRRTYELLSLEKFICPINGIDSCIELEEWCDYRYIVLPEEIEVPCQEICEVTTQLLCSHITLEDECSEDIFPPPLEEEINDDDGSLVRDDDLTQANL